MNRQLFGPSLPFGWSWKMALHDFRIFLNFHVNQVYARTTTEAAKLNTVVSSKWIYGLNYSRLQGSLVTVFASRVAFLSSDATLASPWHVSTSLNKGKQKKMDLVTARTGRVQQIPTLWYHLRAQFKQVQHPIFYKLIPYLHEVRLHVV